jgi:ATP-binding cassette subfamily F protein 3
VVWQRPNLLVLDEPTNHLDLEMRHAMEVALQSFDGALILVSHDRHMLRNTVEELLLVHDGRVESYEDDLNAYEKWILASYSSTDAPTAGASDSNRKEKRQQAAAERAKLRPLTQQLTKVEAEMEKLSKALSELEQQLANPAIYEPGEKNNLAELLRQQRETKSRAQAFEDRWLELQEELEALTSE